MIVSSALNSYRYDFSMECQALCECCDYSVHATETMDDFGTYSSMYMIIDSMLLDPTLKQPFQSECSCILVSLL